MNEHEYHLRCRDGGCEFPYTEEQNEDGEELCPACGATNLEETEAPTIGEEGEFYENNLRRSMKDGR